jgi:hypothetical protein
MRNHQSHNTNHATKHHMKQRHSKNRSNERGFYTREDDNNTTTMKKRPSHNNNSNNKDDSRNVKRRRMGYNKSRKGLDEKEQYDTNHNSIMADSEEIERLNQLILETKPLRQYRPSLTDKIAFRTLPISDRTIRGLDDANYHTMTDIQNATLFHALAGRDILGAAKTGRYVQFSKKTAIER